MNKLFTKVVGVALGLTMAVGVGVAIGGSKEAVAAHATSSTASWAISQTNKLSGTSGTFEDSEGNSWSWTSDKSAGNLQSSNTCQQIGSNGNAATVSFSTSDITDMITSVTVECASYQAKHTIAITVGGDTYLAATATPQWTTVDSRSGTGTSSGEIVISFAPGESARAMYIKSITVEHESGGGSTKTLSSISVGGSMTKTTYATDEAWSPAGLTVIATYDDASTASVTGSATWTYSPAEPNSTSITSVTATASYTEGGVTKTANSSAQSVTVTDKGTSSNPYTVSEAWAICDALSSGANNGKAVHVTGVVSGTVTVSSGRGTFDITDGTKTLKAYSITGVTNSDSSLSTYVGDGYTVVITGAIIKYNASTYEVGYASGFTTSLVSSVAPATVTEIAVKTAPTKTAYKSGESFVAIGLVITATYSDSSTEDIPYAGNEASFSFSPTTITADGNVTITYRGQTCTQAVTLITVTDVTGVASAPTEAYQNASISASDVTLNVTYSDSTTGTVTPDSVSCDTSALGSATATATYNAATGTKTATWTVTVKKEPVYDTIVDELTVADTGISGTGYGSWSGVTKTSGAVYAGSTNENASGGIGMRQDTSKDPAGIFVTASEGVATKVEVTWTTTSSRTIHIKGQNTPYSSIEHAANVTGTEVGTIAYDSTSVNLSAEYKYLCIYVTGGAAGMSSIKITWKVEGAADPLTANPTLSTGATAEVHVGKNLALSVTTTPVDSDERLIVTSSNTDYLTVSGSDRTYTIHGVAIGSATVTVKGAKGTYQSSVVVSVTAAVKTFEDKIMTPDDLGITAYDTSDTTYSFDGSDYTVKQVMKSGGFQFKKDAGYFYNAEALYASNNIKTVTLIMKNTNANEPTVYEGSTAGAQTTSLTPKATFDATGVNTYELSGSTQFFRIDASSVGVVVIEKIIVEMEDSSSTVLSHARSAASTILNALKDTCGAGNSGIVTQSQWDSLNASLTDLSLTVDEKQFLKDATRLSLDNLSQGGATIENAMAHYDACVTKFGYTPFTGITNVQASAKILPSIVGESGTTVSIIVIISMVSLTAIGGYFFIRKRKEQ